MTTTVIVDVPLRASWMAKVVTHDTYKAIGGLGMTETIVTSYVKPGERREFHATTSRVIHVSEEKLPAPVENPNPTPAQQEGA